MFSENYRIATVTSVQTVNDREGRVVVKEARRTAAFIFTLSGRLVFTPAGGGETTVACAGHPVYIPAGCGYRNECPEEAVSLLFNLLDENPPTAILPLPALPREAVSGIYRTVQTEFALGKPPHTARILSALYRLVAMLEDAASPDVSVLRPAVEYLAANYARADLCLAEIADAAHISVVYLTKLFRREYGVPPFRYLTELRMRHARELLGERYRISDVARQVGYADVYQFSRAYKRSFGVPPSREYENG